MAAVLIPHEQYGLEQLHARGFFEDVEHPVVGAHPHATWPVRFSTVGGRFHRRRPPMFGEHNKEVLGELGYNLEELSELEDAGVIGTRPRTTELSHGGPP